MPPESSAELLRQFARHGSEEAFRQLTARFAGMVYAAAERRLGAFRHLAADVTQTVFILLARRARVLPEGIVLSAWLLRQTMRQSLNALRSERRRQAREQLAAAAMIRTDNHFRQEHARQERVPELDEVLLRLPARERDAVMLRFFEDHSMAKVAEALGISENAAQKRVTRGLERLRRRLASRVAATGTASLAATLAAHASTEVPHGLMRSLAGQALAAGSAAPAGGLTAIFEAWRRYPVSALLGAGMAMVAGGGLVFSRATTATTGKAEQKKGVIASAERTPPKTEERERATLAAPSLEEIVRALDRENSEPQNLRTLLRMDALIALVRQSDIPAFAELADGKLSRPAKATVFPRILTAWAKHAPEAAMDFLVSKDLPGQTANQKPWVTGDPETAAAGIALEVYKPWLERDAVSAARWLTDNLNAPALSRNALDSSIAGFLAAVTAEKLALHSVKDMVEFAVSLPEGSARKEAMEGVAGEMERPYARTGWDAARWRDAAALVAGAVQNGGLPPDVLRRFTGRWTMAFPADCSAWLTEQPSGETMLYASLGPAMEDPMRHNNPVSAFLRGLSGRSPTATPAERLELASKAMKEVETDKLAPLLEYVAANWQPNLQAERQLGEWVRRQTPGPEADSALMLIARRAVNGRPEDALAVAELVSNPEQRETLITGLMRRWYSQYGHTPEAALHWMNQLQWPAERIARVRQRIERP